VESRPDEPARSPDDEPHDDAATPPARQEPDPDAAFRAIVEGFSRSPDAPVPPWPVEEDVAPERRSSRDDADRRPPPRPQPPPAGLPGWVEPAPVEDEHHYVPPPPPPAPRVKPRTVAACGAVLLGIVLLFAPSLVDVASGAGSSFLGLLLAGGGAGALVYWMRDAPGVDEGPDDGAVV
jgi:hypothetical protein